MGLDVMTGDARIYVNVESMPRTWHFEIEEDKARRVVKVWGKTVDTTFVNVVAVTYIMNVSIARLPVPRAVPVSRNSHIRSTMREDNCLHETCSS
jgi:hypothetical protein